MWWGKAIWVTETQTLLTVPLLVECTTHFRDFPKSIRHDFTKTSFIFFCLSIPFLMLWLTPLNSPREMPHQYLYPSSCIAPSRSGHTLTSEFQRGNEFFVVFTLRQRNGTTCSPHIPVVHFVMFPRNSAYCPYKATYKSCYWVPSMALKFLFFAR